MKHGAGFIIICPTKKTILLALRNDVEPTWANFGGTIEKCESPLQAAKREVLEEAGFLEETHYNIISNRPINVSQYNHFIYKCYLATSDIEYIPILNYEHYQYEWFKLDSLPENLHFGLKNILSDQRVLKKISTIFDF